MKITVIIIFITLLFPVNAQKLNDSYLKARAAMHQESYTEAISLILSVPPGNRTAAMHQSLGDCYFVSGIYHKAITAYQAADSIKKSPEAQLGIARSYASLSDPFNATEYLKKYLGNRDKLSEGELTLDPALEKIERTKEWKELWNKEWYQSSEQKLAEARILNKRKKYIDALNIIDSEIQKRSSSSDLYATRAVIYQNMEQPEAAYESISRAIRIRNNEPEYYIQSAGLALLLGKNEAALEDINRAIRFDPYRLDLYLQRSTILRKLNRYDEVREDLNFYFTYLPSDTKVMYQLGLTETESGNTTAGIEYFNILIDLDKTSPDYFLARANAYIKTSNYRMADNDLAQTLDLDPSNAEAWLKKGTVLYQLKDLDNACYYWRKALTLGKREASEFIFKHCAK